MMPLYVMHWVSEDVNLLKYCVLHTKPQVGCLQNIIHNIPQGGVQFKILRQLNKSQTI